MTPQEFLDEFGTLAEAEGGVKKLRELILEFAVRGKLVEQDENDEPAAVLLSRIRIERERQISEKDIRRGKMLPGRIENELGFAIPSTWEWAQFGELGDWGAGATPRRGDDRYYGGDILWLKSGELNDGTVTESEEKITAKALEDCSLRLNQPGDVLVAMYGATIGKLAIAGAECTTNQAVCACTCFTGVYNRFLFLLLKAAKRFFIANSSGAAQPNFSKEKIVRTSAPLPPLAEQHRIVAKVDELMRLCDGLEAVQKQRRGVRLRLNRSSLDRLTSVSSQAEVSAAWQRVCDHFQVLYDTPETLPDLRQTILQLAVQGKLVKQDPNEEPAEVLLSRIEETRSIKTENGSARKRQPVPELTDDDISYNVPDGWSWVQFERIADLAGGVAKGRKLGGVKTVTYPYLRVANVQMGYLDLAVMKEIDIPVDELPKYQLECDDLLLTEGGDWDKLGRTAIWEGQLETCLHQNHVFRGRLFDPDVRPRWVRLVMNSGVGRDYFAKASKQTTNLASINMTQLRSCPIPIPPTAEQGRILKRVTDLLSQVTRLESTLTRREATRTQLLTAAIHGMLKAGT